MYVATGGSMMVAIHIILTFDTNTLRMTTKENDKKTGFST
jgi:hypothetical protein